MLTPDLRLWSPECSGPINLISRHMCIHSSQSSLRYARSVDHFRAGDFVHASSPMIFLPLLSVFTARCRVKLIS